MLPDVTINVSGPTSAGGANPSDTGQVFPVGVTQRGRTDGPSWITSLQQWTNAFGARLASSAAYDWAQTFFEEGGHGGWFGRVFGATAATATLNLLDGSSGVSLVVKAGQAGQQDPGVWANGAAGGLSVAVVAVGSGYQLQVFLGGTFVEASPQFATQQQAVDWSTNTQGQGSNYIVVALGAGSLVPAVITATNLAGGTDGSAVGDSDWQGALDRTPGALGSGQVIAIGRTTAAGQLQALDHAQKKLRFALLDGTDTPTAATLITQAAAVYGAPNNGRRYGQLCAPWDVIPGLTSYSSRTAPPSARLAAQYARVDGLGNPNQPAAGRNGIAQYAQDLSQPNFTDTDRLALNNAGVTLSRRRFGGIIATWGMRTLADQNTDRDWSMAGNVRTVMAYGARAKIIGDAHEFNNIDGFGHELGAFKGALTGPALQLHRAGALYGASPSEAFSIDTGPGVNPPSQITQGIEAANVKLRPAGAAEAILINVVKVPLTETV